jgi:beta-N-acetylhexosaminidase
MTQNNKYLKNLIAKMTLEQKIGSLLTLGFAGTSIRPYHYEYIEKYHCGGLRLTPWTRVFGNYVDPKTGSTVVRVENEDGYKKGIQPAYTSPAEYRKILDQLQRIAMNRPLGIPLHFSFDQEGGSSADYNCGGVNIFPKPMGLRATGDSRLAYEVARAVARQSRAVGFNWIHSPVLDINSNPDNPEIGTRAYSDRVEEVIEYAEQSCRGFQEMRMIATGKHFPGRGDSHIDAHFALDVINVGKDTMLKRELLPYKVLIAKKLLPSIMIAHSVFPAIDGERIATVSKQVITGLLREELGFDGVITTDSMTMGAIATRYGVANACAMALEAGADLVLMKAENHLVAETVATIRKFVEEGRITGEELDRKVYRVLNTKYEHGLFHPANLSREEPEKVIGDPTLIELSKQIGRKSVLIAKDTNRLLPLPKDQKILVIEQINKTPNDSYWHPGVLYKNILKYNKQAFYLETAYTFDDEDKQKILGRVKDYNIVVITNFYMRDRLSNNEFINEMIADKSKKIVVLTNTPYQLSIPETADPVVISFATSPDNMEAAAGVLFGAITPEGEWPIENKLG